MGYGTRPGGGGHTIQTFWPDDTDTDLYIVNGDDLSSILEQCQAKWPGCTPDQLHIESERIHTDCLYYDLYDPSDYTDFLHITLRR